MLTFDKRTEILGRRTSKKLENNTYLVPLRGEHPDVTEYGVMLHNTCIIRITRDGYALTSGGWQTSTTKDRLNKYGPVLIYQRRGVWYWKNDATGKDEVFRDGMLICPDAVGV